MAGTFLIGNGSSGTTATTAPCVVLMQHTAETSGTLKYISVYGTGGGNCKVGIYSNSTGGVPETLLAANNTGAAISASAWTDITIADVSIVSGTVYWLGVAFDTANGVTSTGSTGASRRYKTITYETFTYPDPPGTGWSTGAAPYCVQGRGDLPVVVENYVEQFKLGTVRLFDYTFPFYFSDDGKGVGLTATKSFSLATFLSTTFGLIATKLRVLSTKLTTKLGLISSIPIKVYNIIRKISTKLGITLIKEEDLKFFQTLSSKFGLKAAISKLSKFYKPIDTVVGIKISLNKGIFFLRALFPKLGLKTVRGIYRISTRLITKFGLKVTYSDLYKFIRNFANIFGVKAAYNDLYKIIRTLSTKFGIKAAYSDLYGFIIKISTKFGIKVIYTDIYGFKRLLFTKVGVTLLKEDALKLFKILSTKIGLKSALTVKWLVNAILDEIGRKVIIGLNEIGRVLAYNGPVIESRLVFRRTLGQIVRTFTSNIGLIATRIYLRRGHLYEKLSTTVGILATSPVLGSRLIFRKFTSILGITLTKEEIYTFIRIFITSIGVSLIQDKIVKFFRTLNTSLGLTASISKLTKFYRIRDSLFGLTSSFSDSYGFIRKMSTKIGITLLREEALKLFRVLSTSIGLISSFSRAYHFIRALSTFIGIKSVVSKQLFYQHLLNIKIGVKGELFRLFRGYRFLSSKLGLIVFINYIRGKVENLSTSIGLLVEYSKRTEFIRYFNNTIALVADNFKLVLKTFLTTKISLLVTKNPFILGIFMYTRLGVLATTPSKVLQFFRKLITKFGITPIKEGIIVNIANFVTTLGLLVTGPFVGIRRIIRSLLISVGIAPRLFRSITVHLMFTNTLSLTPTLVKIYGSIKDFSNKIGILDTFDVHKHGNLFESLSASFGIVTEYTKSLKFVKIFSSGIGLVATRFLSLTRIFILNLGIKGNINIKAMYVKILNIQVGLYAQSVWYRAERYGYKILKFLKRRADQLLFKDEDIQ